MDELWGHQLTNEIKHIDMFSVFDTLQLSLLNHRLVLNAEKTKYMLFSTSTCDSDYPAIKTLNGTHITLVESLATFTHAAYPYNVQVHFLHGVMWE